MDEEFKEIPLSDMTLIIDVKKLGNVVQLRTSFSFDHPLPLSVFGIWAAEWGEPLGIAPFHGSPQPQPNSFEIAIATDQRAMWGRKCPHCSGYWRSGPLGFTSHCVCCYCGRVTPAHWCLSDAQLAYVKAACRFFSEQVQGGKDGQFSISTVDLMKRVDDKDLPSEMPRFFAEASQQTKFTCEACAARNDILGRGGYCSCCRTRNDDAMLKEDLEARRIALNSGHLPASTVIKDAVDGFDAVGRNIAEQLCKLVPMTPARRNRWEKLNFSQFEQMSKGLKSDFDIDVLRGVEKSDERFLALMFSRRHLFAHRNGVVDEEYLAETGDTTVSKGQLVKPTQVETNRLIGLIGKLSGNLLRGFHEIIRPIQAPIDRHRENLAETKKWASKGKRETP